MSDVFVSYKSEDRRRVTPLVRALEADGFSVWWDAAIGGGASWRHTIEAELNAAACVIVAWSKHSIGLAGAFVQDEATRAQQRGVYLPVTLDKVALPLGFGELQALALTGWRGDRSDARYAALLAAVRDHVGGDGGPARPTVRRPTIDRRTMVIGAAVGTAGLAGAGAWLMLKSGSSLSSGRIAVLPFENLSGDPAKTYFSDGIAEEIRGALVRLKGVTVIGRTSSEAVRNEDARSAANKLNVSHILTGSVRQSPSTIRVTAELIDGANGEEQWSQNYDRAPGDVIKIQTDIAENVASALSAALSTAVRAAIALGGTQNVEAQDLVLKAQSLTTRDTKETLEQARSLFYRAIALDPNYADAYARNALQMARLAGIYSTNNAEMDSGLQEGLGLARKATVLAPDFASGHGALALMYLVLLKIPLALSEGRRALDLAPNDANALRSQSNLLSLVGNSSQAMILSRKAIAIDPLNPETYRNDVNVFYRARRYGDAVAETVRIRRDSPGLFTWPILFADCLMAAGRLDEARQMYASGEADNPFRLAGEGVLATRQGDRATVAARLERTKVLYSENENYQYAQVHAQMGDRESAIGDLVRALEFKDPGLQFLRVDPWLDPLRSDPRFAALLRKLQFPA